MKRITFKQQLKISFCILLIGCMLSFMFSTVMFLRVGGIIYGAFFVINPVCPSNFEENRQMKTYIRLVGIFIALFSVVVRMRL